MKSFEYTIKNSAGIHARPAGDIARAALNYDAVITISNEKGESCSLGQILGVMLLGVKCGEKVTISAEGPDEEKAVEELSRIFEEKL